VSPGAPPPERPDASGPGVEQEAEYERAMVWLVVVPFSFPMWLRMRRDQPELAERLLWAFWLNVVQSVLCVAAVAAAIVAVVAIPWIVEYWVSRLSS
jgi:hypothetical protein